MEKHSETRPKMQADDTRKRARDHERTIGFRIADCPVCGDAITKNGNCCYCEYVSPNALIGTIKTCKAPQRPHD